MSCLVVRLVVFKYFKMEEEPDEVLVFPDTENFGNEMEYAVFLL